MLLDLSLYYVLNLNLHKIYVEKNSFRLCPLLTENKSLSLKLSENAKTRFIPQKLNHISVPFSIISRYRILTI